MKLPLQMLQEPLPRRTYQCCLILGQILGLPLEPQPVAEGPDGGFGIQLFRLRIGENIHDVKGMVLVFPDDAVLFKEVLFEVFGLEDAFDLVVPDASDLSLYIHMADAGSFKAGRDLLFGLKGLDGIVSGEDGGGDIAAAEIADKIQDDDIVFFRESAEASAELLLEDGVGMGGPQQEDVGDLGDVDAFREDIHRAYDLEGVVFIGELVHGFGPLFDGGGAEEAAGGDIVAVKLLVHITGMADVGAESQGFGFAEGGEEVFEVGDDKAGAGIGA